MNSNWKIILATWIFIVSLNNVSANGCKPPIDFAINNGCDLYHNLIDPINRYICADRAIYSDCEGGVYKSESIKISEKGAHTGLLVAVVIGEVILVIIAVLIVAAIIRKKNKDEK